MYHSPRHSIYIRLCLVSQQGRRRGLVAEGSQYLSTRNFPADRPAVVTYLPMLDAVTMRSRFLSHSANGHPAS